MEIPVSLNKDYEGSYFQIRGVSRKVFEEFQLGTIADTNTFLPQYFLNKPAFPATDINGNRVGMGVRVGEGSMKYMIYGFKKTGTLYGLYQAQESILANNNVIIVEGYFDVLLAFSRGIRNVVGIFGNKISQEQIMILSSFTDNFTLALDSDNPGIEGTSKTKQLIRKVAPGVFVNHMLIFPYKDFADYMQAGDADEEERARMV